MRGTQECRSDCSCCALAPGHCTTRDSRGPFGAGFKSWAALRENLALKT